MNIDILEEKVWRAVKQLKKNQSLNKDNFTGEMMKNVVNCDARDAQTRCNAGPASDKWKSLSWLSFTKREVH